MSKLTCNYISYGAAIKGLEEWERTHPMYRMTYSSIAESKSGKLTIYTLTIEYEIRDKKGIGKCPNHGHNLSEM